MEYGGNGIATVAKPELHYKKIFLVKKKKIYKVWVLLK
jgi:hypothetical protein